MSIHKPQSVQIVRDEKKQPVAGIQKVNYQNLLKTIPIDYSDENRNDRGVCLMRLYQWEAAIQQFRSLVLDRSGVWSRTDLPGYMKVNFATCLFYGGHASGAMDVLTEVHVAHEPGAMKLLQEVAAWEKQMPFWKWLLWKAAHVAPSTAVACPNEPGEFSWEPAPEIQCAV